LLRLVHPGRLPESSHSPWFRIHWHVRFAGARPAIWIESPDPGFYNRAMNPDSEAGQNPISDDLTQRSTTAEIRNTSTRQESILIQIYGPSLGKNYTVDQDLITIGRDESNIIRIDQGNVSRTHCKLERIGQSVFIEDLNSTNGTYLNDASLRREQLRNGDLIRVGGVILKFVSGGNVEALFHEEIYRMTITDGLTQVANKRYLLEFLEREIARASRFRHPLSIVMLDIDHFKAVNDTHGHEAGDYILRELCSVLMRTVRKEELLGRYGGEEFVLALPETSLSNACRVAENARREVEEHNFEFAGLRIAVTISLGAAELSPMTLNPITFIRAADERLYTAKNAGRNRVVG
jgi:two-component system, cell cycle response regulator